jgi:hypothetical protein
LPFNTSDFTDIITVLKEVFDRNIPFKNDKINNIVFEYKLEKPKIKYLLLKKFFKYKYYILATVFLLFVAFIIYLDISSLFNVLFCTETIPKEILDLSNNVLQLDVSKQNSTVKYTNKCIFGIFSDLFEKSNSYRYFPSYFLDNPLKYSSNIKPLLICEQCKVVDDLIKITFDHAEILRDILGRF